MMTVEQALSNFQGQLNAAAAKIRQLDAAVKNGGVPANGAGKTPTPYAPELVGSDGRPAPRFIEDIPGKRAPFTYCAQAAISTTERTPLAFQVSEDGPFVAVYITAHWRPTAGTFVGRWRPISSDTPVNADGLATDCVDFEYEIMQGGSDRLWQGSSQGSVLRASRDLFSDGGDGRPHYLGIAGFFERNENAIVNVAMLRTPDHAGLLKFEFHGYKIITPIKWGG